MTSLSAVRGLTTLIAATIIVAAACGGKVTIDPTGAGAQGGAAGTAGSAGTAGAGNGPTSVTTGPVTTTTSTVTPMTDVVTTTGGNPGQLAAPCNGDADCGGGWRCIKVTDNDPVLGGGVAGGYCTRSCASDSDCPGFGSACLVGPDGTGECFLGCTFGDPALNYLNDPLDPSKCLGREDLRCKTTEIGDNLCLPLCGADAHCEGRKCDPRTEVCVDVPSAGEPLGAKCDPMAMDCAGLCITLAPDSATMCTSPCTMGGEVPNDFECGGAGVGICLYSPAGTGAGDEGYCAPRCTAQDQCQAPDFFCFNIGLPDGGTCLDTEACMTDADCTFLSSKCIATKLGSFCMSPEYPLGSLAP